MKFIEMGEAVASSDEGMGMVVDETAQEKDEKKNEKGESRTDSIGWGRLLPRMVLRVLLVEADDSTRQIIAALLRKCSYRVAAVSDGLKAWETLKGRPHNIDLILTEVELPSISGYALLTLIMEHDVCKNIPVIMMSSNDSISLVLKCMLKGAADFLIKPVRKNELKNLWQHVWRRKTQTSSHDPESVANEQHKLEASSENNAASHLSSDHLPPINRNKECIRKASDAQSSCKAPFSEAENAYMQNMWGLTQLNHGSAPTLNAEKCEESVQLVEKSVTLRRETGGESKKHGGACYDEVNEQIPFIFGDVRVCSKARTGYEDRGTDSHRGHVKTSAETCLHAIISKPSSEALDLIGKFEHSRMDSSEHSTNDDTNFCSALELELSSRRFHLCNLKDEATDARDKLKHSDASAFSRYDNSKSMHPTFPILESKCPEHHGGSTCDNHASGDFEQTIAGQLHRAGYGGSLKNMASVFVGQCGQIEVAAFLGAQPGFAPGDAMTVDNSCAGYGQIFPPMFYTQSGVSPQLSPKSASHQEQSPFWMSSSLHSGAGIHSSVQGHLHKETPNNFAGSTMEEDTEARCSSPTPLTSNVGSLQNGTLSKLDSCLCESILDESEGDATGTSAAAIMTLSEGVNDNSPIIRGGLRGVDSHFSNHREAALMKFRLKRKDRCYDKKVRYQSRKRLAEQRPRVKGQFVRQAPNDPPAPEFEGNDFL